MRSRMSARSLEASPSPRVRRGRWRAFAAAEHAFVQDRHGNIEAKDDVCWVPLELPPEVTL
jgi:hypothetical protein